MLKEKKKFNASSKLSFGFDFVAPIHFVGGLNSAAKRKKEGVQQSVASVFTE